MKRRQQGTQGAGGFVRVDLLLCIFHCTFRGSQNNLHLHLFILLVLQKITVFSVVEKEMWSRWVPEADFLWRWATMVRWCYLSPPFFIVNVVGICIHWTYFWRNIFFFTAYSVVFALSLFHTLNKIVFLLGMFL